MKTAVQEAIIMVKNRIETIDETLMGKHSIHHLQQVERDLYDLLEKEKEQIIDFSIGAYQDISRMKGVPENLISENKIIFEEYYNQNK